MEHTLENQILNEKFKLATVEKDQLVSIFLYAVIITLGFVLWHLMGNTTDTRIYSRSIFMWVVRRWATDGEALYSHGKIVPFISVFLLYINRTQLMRVAKKVFYPALALFFLALFFHYVGVKAQHPRLSGAAFIIALWALPTFLFGWKVGKLIMFPCFYLIFCLPLHFLEGLTNPLKMMSASWATGLVQGIGIEMFREGNILVFPDGTTLGVEDACSGLRSLLALTALTAVYGYLMMPTFVKKCILFISAIPLAIIGNTVRITSIAVVHELMGSNNAEVYHDFSTFIVFAVAVGLMVAIGNLLTTDIKAKIATWKHVNTSPTSS